MKANDIFEQAMLMYGMVNTDGVVDETRAAPYRQRAVAAINLLQRDIYRLENPPVCAGGTAGTAKDITSLGDDVAVSDDSAGRCLVYGLVMAFAEQDRDDFLYNTYAAEYQSRLAAIAQPSGRIRNVRRRMF